MSGQVHACVRCGIAMYAAGAICRDCRYGDPVYVRLISGAAS
jgi:hypothetical protein